MQDVRENELLAAFRQSKEEDQQMILALTKSCARSDEDGRAGLNIIIGCSGGDITE
jgi:RNase adaptor protein for sRNA GlmZ degradation